jgi:ribosomal protein S6--L-glutamate ligase
MADLLKRDHPNAQERKVLSMHPVIEADSFCWARGLWDRDLLQKLQDSGAVILPQTVDRELYHLCRKICPRVFPNYDLRFRWEGKVGDTFAFWAHKTKHPHTMVFPRVETLLGDHPDMGLKDPELEERLQSLLQGELQGKSGFVIQEYLSGLEKDLRVVIIGRRILSYWRSSQGFHHNIVKGGEIDTESDPELQSMGREKVRQFCNLTGINLAAFDLAFHQDGADPFFLEINYTFGRKGLGGSEKFYGILREEVKKWLHETD